VKIALVGCGGRGSGAAGNALSTPGPTKLWAMADAFSDRLQASLNNLSRQFPKQVDVPKERQFVGLDAYRKAIECVGQGGVVLLATPPAFRPIHVEYAVAKGVHVFMEKGFAVDVPGVRRLLRAGELAAQKNLKIAGGLMWRHEKGREEVIRRLHDGAIGDLIHLRTYRMHMHWGSVPRKPEMTELAYQIRNWLNFYWLSNGMFAEPMIHNLDVCCWAKNAWPASALAQGGRQVGMGPGQVWDHYAVEYTFPDGTHLMAQMRFMAGVYARYADFAHGAKGSAVIMESLAAPKPRIYKNHHQVRENETWRYEGPPSNEYQVEHDLLFEAIRQDKPHNEAERCAKAQLTAILGRTAAHSGQLLTWDEVLASNAEVAPGLEKFNLDSTPPVLPDGQGRYPIPGPGVAKE
jgi:predicted dehydrogenase